ncbi:MAG: CNNM domain-containing protein [Candidatus Sabulitectum sp.]|nr:CNNM domain-containing protein [Candidatus Sabulitectum sp.]
MSATARGRRALKLLIDPGRLLTSILLGNTFVNVAASSLAAGITADLIPGTLGLGIGVLVMTFLLLVLGEISPKTLARRRNREWVEASARIMGLALRLLSPAAKLLTHPAEFADRFFPGREGADSYMTAELYILMEMARDEGILGGEAATAVAILELDERHCVSAMVPREKVHFLMSDWSIDTLKEEAAKSFHTAYPYIDHSTGLMTGVVDVRDLLGKDKFTIREVPFFPESARLNRVLSDLRAFGCRMGAVVDEYGDWTGIISVADILERAVFAGSAGVPLPEGVNRSGHGFLIPASLPVDTLATLMNSESLSARYAESCGGLLQEVTGRLPARGEVIEHSGFTFRIIEVHANSLERIMVERTEKS